MGWEFRAWVVLPETGQIVEVGAGRHFGQNVTIAGPRGNPGPPLFTPVSKPNPREADSIPSTGADSVPLHKKGQPERVARFVPRDSLPRPGWLEEDLEDVLQGEPDAPLKKHPSSRTVARVASHSR
jgi:hypothetical protein